MSTDVSNWPMDLPATAGMRHVAFYVADLEACEQFYTRVLGMSVEWRPDADNVFLTSAGQDNLALHRRAASNVEGAEGMQRLDHIGFILRKIEDVDRWHAHFQAQQVPITAQPKTHRDGARSFYAKDPAGNSVQVIYHPPISDKL
ncbi:MAG: VOC family protein [Gammaproteobacteria bacterium]|nr:VOC family protein [Gammaproteobacteria bacterium]